MPWRSGSNEVRQNGRDIYVNNDKVGYQSGNEYRINGNTYRESGGDVYCNNERVGYRTGDGDIRMNDGSLWKNR